MYWHYEKRRAPKAAPGATRKNYGSTWWGKQWLQALADIDYSNRLPRGKTYANKGLAHDLELQGNTITAKVTGTQSQPYRVQITVPAFDPDTRERLVRLVTENPLFLSKLLNRELPPELNEACLAENIHVFPRRWDDLRGACSCPDWAVPCKHMAAVLYLVANEIDKNPFVVFDLHGFDLVAALQESGYTEAAGESVSIPALSQWQQPVTEADPVFTLDEERLAALDFSTLPDCRDNLIRLLSEKPVFFPEGDFKKILAAAYKSIASGVEKAAAIGQEGSDAQAHILQNAEKVLLMLDAGEGNFLGCSLLDARDESLNDFNSAAELAAFLEALPHAQVAQSAPELRALHLAYQLAEMLARKGAYVPQIISFPVRESQIGVSFFIRFVPALLNGEVRAVCEQAAGLMAPGMLVYIGDKQNHEPIPADYLPALLAVFLGHFVRENTEKVAREGELPRWFFSGLPAVFERFENREYPKNIQLWLSRFFIAEKDFVPVFEVNDDEDLFEVSVSIEDKTAAFQTPVPLDAIFSTKKYARLRLDALRDLSMVAEFFPPLNDLIASKGKAKLRFDSRAFVEVYFNALPVIRLFGIRVLLPKALQKLLRPAASMSLSANNKGKVAGAGLLSFSNMIDFQWQIALGDQLLSPEAFLKMVKTMRGIVRLADGYAYVDEKEIAALLGKIEHTPAPTGPKLLQIALAGEYQGAPVHLDESARALIAELLRPDSVALPAGLHAKLRPYQLRGFEWLYKNTRLGFGSLIADDMGLGKTLQVITTLQRLKEDGALSGHQKALVVVPTTLLTNWSKEIARFAPGLSTHVYHGPGRSLAPLADADILLTTYGVVRSEIAALQKKDWLVAIIDEAQNIKNLETAQTKAVKKLKAPVRIAMTGTPVENRLSEYFSLFEFANRGYLGSLKEFTEEYAKPIELERNHAALERFRRVTAPFLLRRVKTDKTIISDLPDKIETNQFCTLTPEQAALYQNVVDESLRAIEKEKEGDIKRQGLVLKMLTALKQVCNHPSHFLKKPEADPALSGKTQLLLDLLTQILDNGEKTLIFTQYREMGELIVPLLREQLGLNAAFLHGGVSRKGRDEMVEAFQHQHSDRILLLSLKAGGTGLNLTAASNVIHYDLWWNPAVEAQATDRAFRIGQQRNVQVHRFITQGTFEEKINAMLQAKKELANLTVTAGERWVGDLTDGELRELVRLGG
ncbi:MAG: DEAD/DEAH box helicase family protein [Lewinellaceae bacterium]|nr:DEAD/DEAH box helicase family protein [Saprospiraceae bacterium]MCB9334169.1 DEAD/DEAH box helicase family protein [Lewinellaceae bacterium]